MCKKPREKEYIFNFLFLILIESQILVSKYTSQGGGNRDSLL